MPHPAPDTPDYLLQDLGEPAGCGYGGYGRVELRRTNLWGAAATAYGINSMATVAMAFTRRFAPIGASPPSIYTSSGHTGWMNSPTGLGSTRVSL